MKKVERVMQRRETTLYTAEFREKAVERFAAGKLSSPAFADSIGVNRETFRRWVKKARKPGQTVSSQVLALRAEVTRLSVVTATLASFVEELVAGKGKRGGK
jgi:transposase-like protein